MQRCPQISFLAQVTTFSKEFNKAIEAKVSAEQNALKAENKAKETITLAEAEKEVKNKQAEAGD